MSRHFLQIIKISNRLKCNIIIYLDKSTEFIKSLTDQITQEPRTLLAEFKYRTSIS